MKSRISTVLGAIVLAGAAQLAHASEVTLRFHQFLPPQANIPAKAIAPWAQKVERDSGGRIKVQLFSNMQLGGKPAELFDQARTGVVDIVWAVLGFTPGRFPKSEAFELPFTCGAAEACSRAFFEFVQKHAADEFKDVKVIALHTHGPGLIHSKDPVTRLEDLKGMKVRGGSRIVNIMLEQLGATPVGMPATAVTEALSKGVVAATTFPWEVVPSLKVHELVKNHTGFTGEQGLYTLTFVVAMNRAAYDKLPADLKRVIDANSGIETSAQFGRVMDEGDKEAAELARKAGNRIIMLDAVETLTWRRTAAAVRDRWYKEVGGRGIDGPMLAAEAEAFVRKHARR